MEFYYVNKNAQPNGIHDVHSIGCINMPSFENRLFLGKFQTCEDAVREAQKTYPLADGCSYCCCRVCHSS